MRKRRPLGVVCVLGLAAAAGLACYCGAYIATADLTDVGSNRPMYLVRYRVGSVSLQSLAPVFEPVRRIDDAWFRSGHLLVMEYLTP